MLGALMSARARIASLAMAVGACLSARGAQADPAKRPPSFLLVVADDLGWRDVGYHGSEIRTPHLDRLARQGVRLERHYVYPTCSPTRAGLLTGRNPSRFGIDAPIAGRSTDTLPFGVMTLARALKRRGYATALFGKWHLGLRPEVGPRRFGFDRSYGYLHGQVDPYTHLYKNGDRTWHRDDVLLDEEGHATDLIAAEAARFLEARREEPFFLWVAFSVPHHPLQEDEKWLAPYADAIADPWRRLFAASVTHMDAAVGRIAEALEKSGRAGETLVLFTSDNGAQRDYSSATEYGGKFEPHATLGDNRPLRDWKGSLYEGGVRVPAFVRWKDRLEPAAVAAAVSVLDWFPTLLRLAGVPVAPDWKIEGKDTWPLLTGDERSRAPRVIYWNVGDASAVISGDWKLIVRREGPAELYNLARDPGEEKDRAAAEPARVEELRRALAAQRALDP
jgi:arylsulfatase A-like enzyme